jgi:hypothetical protein
MECSGHGPVPFRRCDGSAGCCARDANGHDAADEQYELASFHSITWSARASIDGGISRPSAFAVLRLIAISYLVDACTGRSAGFSPLRIT